MSSHQMTSIEEFCTDVLILNKGKTVLQGNLNEIKNKYPSNKIELKVSKNVDKIVENIGLKILSNEDNNYIISITDENQGYELYKKLANENINVIKFEMKKPSLHDIFLEKVGE